MCSCSLGVEMSKKGQDFLKTIFAAAYCKNILKLHPAFTKKMFMIGWIFFFFLILSISIEVVPKVSHNLHLVSPPHFFSLLKSCTFRIGKRGLFFSWLLNFHGAQQADPPPSAVMSFLELMQGR